MTGDKLVDNKSDNKVLEPSNLQALQTASNPLPVSHALHQVAKALYEREKTTAIAHQPEFRAILLKLCNMAEFDIDIKEYMKPDIQQFF